MPNHILHPLIIHLHHNLETKPHDPYLTLAHLLPEHVPSLLTTSISSPATTISPPLEPQNTEHEPFLGTNEDLQSCLGPCLVVECYQLLTRDGA